MIRKKHIIRSVQIITAVSVIAVFLAGCASTAPNLKVPEIEEAAKKKAMDLFIEGKVAESNKEFGEAIASYMEALQYDPKSVEITFFLAEVFVRSGKVRSSLYYAKRATRLDPLNPKAWRLLQWVERHEGNFENSIEALEMYMKLSSEKDFNDIVKLAQLYFSVDNPEKAKSVLLSNIKDKNTPAFEMDQAAELLAANEFIDDAVSIYQRITERDPTNTSAWLAMGALYSENRREEEADQAFRLGLEKNPDSLYLMKAIGNHCLDKNDWECAISYFEQAVAGGDKNKQLRKTLCALYFYAGQDDKGLAAHDALKEQGEDDASLYFSLAKSMNYLERYEEALGYYRTGFSKVEETFPEEPLIKAYFGMAGVLIKLNREDEAVDLIHNKAKTAIEDYTTLKILESSFYIELKRYEDAIAILEWLSASDPENISFYIRLSFVYDMSDEFEKAEKVLLKVLKLEPEHPLALNNLAYMYIENDKNIGKAISMVKRALEKEPDNGAYHDTLGWGHYKKGKYKNARKYIESALKLADEHDKGVIYEHLGDILIKLGKSKKAAEAYHNAIEFGEDKDRIQPKLDALDIE